MRKLSLLFFGVVLMATQALAQRTITGTVTDANGLPLGGVSIIVKGTPTGTSSRSDGTYSLQIPANAKTLVFTSVDFEATEMAIGDKAVINASLGKVDKALDEVVVVAYGTVKKEAFTGSVGTIKPEDIAKRPLGNAIKAIEGAVPGVVTTSGSGQPGASISIRVRGFGSFSATQEPLFVIDGVPYVGGSSNLNPDDVESITILKDASATALYGSRAGNGVVMITTRKGRKGRNNISVKLAQGLSSRGMQEYERVNAFQYYPLMWESYKNSLVYPTSGTPLPENIASQIATGLLPRNGVGLQVYNGRSYADISQLLVYNPFNVSPTSIVDVSGKINPSAQLIYPDDLDWTKDLLRNGVRRDYGANFSGGSDKSDYYFSVGYVKESGYTIKTDFERYSTRLNLNLKPLEWLKTGLNISGNYSTSNSANEDGAIANPFSFTRNIGPIYPYYAHNMTSGNYVLDEKGNKIWDLGNFQNEPIGIANGIGNRPNTTAGRHAPAEIILNEELFKRWAVSARTYAEISFLKNFKFTTNIAVDNQSQTNNSYENTLVGDGAPGGRSQRAVGNTTGFTVNQLLNYNKKFGVHRIDALVGHENFNDYETDLNGFKQGQSLTGNTELGNFTTINSLNSSVDKYRIESYFSRVNYDFDNKYLVSASLRRDGNSRFSSQSRWGTFWSLGGGWNIAKEKFMENVSWIDNLKLRGGYGLVGVADGIGFYAYQGLYEFANNANEPGIVQSQTSFENLDLTWEVNTQSDIGLDFSFFKSRLSGSIEYFNRQSKDLLFAVPQPLSSGALSVTKNTATLYNKGIEVQLNADIIRSKSFTWNTGINFSTVNNKITKMPEGVDEFISGTKKYQVGASLYDYWLRSYYGVDPVDGAALYRADNTSSAPTTRLIQNNHGGTDTVTTLISNGRFEYHKGVIPDLYGSFSQLLKFKEFTLSALFTYQLGGNTYDGNYQTLMSSGSYGNAIHKDILTRWQKPGDITNVPRMDNGATTNFNATSSRWLIDASYLNIRALNLAYELPKSILSRIKLSGGQFYISIENVAFFSKRKGMNNQNAFSGITSGSYPPARIVTAGITFNL